MAARGAAILALVFLGATVGTPSAAASNCPTRTFLSFDHLAYASKPIPSAVRLAPGARLGSGAIDEPASADGCKRRRDSVDVLAAGSIEPRVAVMSAGRPRTVFVLGHRCEGATGAAYWDCLLRPLVFRGRRFTGTRYPAGPAPRRTVPLGAPLGTGQLEGRTVAVRSIEGVDPAVAVGVSGRTSEAFVTAAACPYEGFSNTPAYDDLLRCLRSPVWFTFDPPGVRPAGTVVARSDRPPRPEVAGARIGLVRLPLVADLVPKRHPAPLPIGRVAGELSFEVPKLRPGLYEAVVSCPRCDGGKTLYPAGSILVASERKTSVGIRIVSYALTAAVVAAALLLVRSWRQRRRATRPGPAGS